MVLIEYFNILETVLIYLVVKAFLNSYFVPQSKP